MAENIEVNFDDNNIKLAITPLTQRKDKFLYVYFESPGDGSYRDNYEDKQHHIEK